MHVIKIPVVKKNHQQDDRAAEGARPQPPEKMRVGYGRRTPLFDAGDQIPIARNSERPQGNEEMNEEVKAREVVEQKNFPVSPSSAVTVAQMVRSTDAVAMSSQGSPQSMLTPQTVLPPAASVRLIQHFRSLSRRSPQHCVNRADGLPEMVRQISIPFTPSKSPTSILTSNGRLHLKGLCRVTSTVMASSPLSEARLPQ